MTGRAMSNKNHKNTRYIPKWEKGQERPCLRCGPENKCLNHGPCQEYGKWNSWDLKKQKLEDLDVPDGVYDNPLTNQREKWKGNKVVTVISKEDIVHMDHHLRWKEFPSPLEVVESLINKR